MAEASDFKFGTLLGFAKVHHKITPRGNCGGGLGLAELPKILGFPIIFLQRPHCLLIVSGASCLNDDLALTGIDEKTTETTLESTRKTSNYC